MPTANPTIKHPDWCDLARCTAKPSSEFHGAHRSTPGAFAAEGVQGLAAAASLYRAEARWLTRTHVEITFLGVNEQWEDAEVTVSLMMASP